MTIEVRQMVIKSTVGDDQPHVSSASGGGQPAPELERLREEILAECQQLFELKLRDMLER